MQIRLKTRGTFAKLLANNRLTGDQQSEWLEATDTSLTAVLPFWTPVVVFPCLCSASISNFGRRLFFY
jgi:hypothetical protein